MGKQDGLDPDQVAEYLSEYQIFVWPVFLTIISAEHSHVPTDIVAWSTAEQHFSPNKSLLSADYHIVQVLYLVTDSIYYHQPHCVTIPSLCNAGVLSTVLLLLSHIVLSCIMYLYTSTWYGESVVPVILTILSDPA